MHRRTAASPRSAPAWPEWSRVRARGNAGFAAANNEGIRPTRGELLLLLNNDTLVPPGAIDALVGRMRARPAAGVAGSADGRRRGAAELSFGAMISPLNELRQKVIAGLHQRRVGPITRWVERETRREQFVDWVSGACLLVRRTAPTRRACSTSAISSIPRMSTSARRFAHRAGRCCSRRPPRSSTCAAARAPRRRPEAGTLSTQSSGVLRQAPPGMAPRSSRVPAPEGAASAIEFRHLAHRHRRTEAPRFRHRDLRPERPAPAVAHRSHERVRGVLPEAGLRRRGGTRREFPLGRRRRPGLFGARTVQRPDCAQARVAWICFMRRTMCCRR